MEHETKVFDKKLEPGITIHQNEIKEDGVTIEGVFDPGGKMKSCFSRCIVIYIPISVLAIEKLLYESKIELQLAISSIVASQSRVSSEEIKSQNYRTTFLHVLRYEFDECDYISSAEFNVRYDPGWFLEDIIQNLWLDLHVLPNIFQIGYNHSKGSVGYCGFLTGCFVEHNVVGIRFWTNSNVSSKNTLMLGADYYEMASYYIKNGYGFMIECIPEASVNMLLKFGKVGYSVSYGGVMRDAFGNGRKKLLESFVVINNIGVLIVYMIIIGDVLFGASASGVYHAGVLQGWCGEQWWNGRAFVLLATTLCVFAPLGCFKRIDSLRFTSALAVGLALLFLVINAGITVVKWFDGSITMPRWLPDVTDINSAWKLFTVVPVLVTAYICHFNVHPIEKELEDFSLIQLVEQTSLALCSTVYIMTSFFGILLFGEAILDDVLANFDRNLGIPYSYQLNDVVRVSYALHLMLVFPMVFHPLRFNLDALLFPSAGPLVSDNFRFTWITIGLNSIVYFALAVLYLPESPGYCDGIRVREAKTEAFAVKDHMGELYKKHYPPALHDEVWRLDRIAKEGALHKKLMKSEIITVEDFLRVFVRDPQRLRNILGSGMSNRMWDNTVEHAKTCVLGGKLYIYYADGAHSIGAVFNHIYELRGLITDGQFLPLESLNYNQKISVDALVKGAYENWNQVIEYDGKVLNALSINNKKGTKALTVSTTDQNHITDHYYPTTQRQQYVSSEPIPQRQNKINNPTIPQLIEFPFTRSDSVGGVSLNTQQAPLLGNIDYGSAGVSAVGGSYISGDWSGARDGLKLL